MVRIITDSASDFEPYELKKLMIDCIPLSVSFGEQDYKDGITLTKDAFFDKLKNSNLISKTSQPSLHDIINQFKTTEQNKDGCVAIFMSSKISGTVNTAKTALEMIDSKNVFIIDSLTTSAGQRLLVEYAVQLRNQGKTALEIYEKLENIKPKISMLACLDTIEYLHRGGRVTSAKAIIGAVTHIKPIIKLHNGNVELITKSFSLKRGISSLITRLEREQLNPLFAVYVMYSDDISLANDLIENLQTVMPNFQNIKAVQVGAVIGSHIGTKACGIAFVKL